MHIVALKEVCTTEIDLLEEMYRLRGRIFHGRLSWKVQCVEGREYDEFDALFPTYIIAVSASDHVVGCARLLPASGPTMLETVFPQLLNEPRLSSHAGIVESSRFCIDTSFAEGRGQTIHEATLAMFAGIIEWSLLNGYSEIVTATDVRFERILRRAGWPMARLGNPMMISETLSIAGRLPADRSTFERLRPASYTSDLTGHYRRVA